VSQANNEPAGAGSALPPAGGDDTLPADDHVTAVRALARLHRMIECADSGLTVPQYRVLASITQGGVRSARLAAQLAVRRPTLTAIADGLVAAGYAYRESEAGDRRVVRLHVTDSGRAALAAADAVYVDMLRRLLGEIPHPERLVASLVAVSDALEARLTTGDTPPRDTAPRDTPPRHTAPRNTPPPSEPHRAPTEAAL
jgi:DNA-binding MarR family transcriptional regulator